MLKFAYYIFSFTVILPVLFNSAVTAQPSGADSTFIAHDSTEEPIQNSKTFSQIDSIISVKDSSTQTSGQYSDYSRSQRGGRGVSSGGGPSSQKPERRRIIKDSLSTVTDTSAVTAATDTVPSLPQDSTQTFSLYKMSTRGKIITGISATAIVGGVITFFLVKKVHDQIPEPLPLPEPPSPPDF